MGAIVALDPGFGNTKVCLDGKVSVIQSIAVSPKRIGMAGLGIKTASPGIDVAFDDHHFAVGPGATEWGTPQSNLDYSSLMSPERQALFYAALAPLLSQAETSEDLLIVGLPVPLLQDEQQAGMVLTDLKRPKGRHAFRVGKEEFEIEVEKLKVFPQTLGAYADWLLDDTIRVRNVETEPNFKINLTLMFGYAKIILNKVFSIKNIIFFNFNIEIENFLLTP